MNACLVNIGNTNTEFCSLNLSNRVKVPTSDFKVDAKNFLSSYDTCFAASVVPELTDALFSLCPHLEIHLLKVDDISSIDFTNIDSSTIGADRLANLLSAQALFGPNALVLDCGTCVTAELLLDDCFKGGFIMPGRQLQRRALASYTGQLPAVPIDDETIELGSNTLDSIKVGIDTLSALGVQTWVDEQVLKTPNLKVCFTGGDRNFYSEKVSFDFSITEDLTLRGLRAFANLFKASK